MDFRDFLIGLLILGFIVAFAIMFIRGRRSSTKVNDVDKKAAAKTAYDEIEAAAAGLATSAKKAAGIEIGTLVSAMIDFEPQKTSLNGLMTKIETIITEFQLGSDKTFLKVVYTAMIDNKLVKQAGKIAKDNDF